MKAKDYTPVCYNCVPSDCDSVGCPKSDAYKAIREVKQNGN